MAPLQKAEVNPYQNKGPAVLEKKKFSDQAEKHSLFLKTAIPYLEKLRPF